MGLEALKKSREMRQIAKAKAAAETKKKREEEARERKARKERMKDLEPNLALTDEERRRRALRRARLEERRKVIAAMLCCRTEQLQEFKSGWRRLHYSFTKSSCHPKS